MDVNLGLGGSLTNLIDVLIYCFGEVTYWILNLSFGFGFDFDVDYWDQRQ